MYTFKEHEYELRYTIGKVHSIEKALGGASFVRVVTDNDGMISLTALEAIFVHGLKHADKETYADRGVASEIFNEALTEKGYAETIKDVMQAVARDLGFLFRIDS